MNKNNLAIWKYRIALKSAYKKASDLELQITSEELAKELTKRNKKK